MIRNFSSGFSGIKKKKKEEEDGQIRLGQHVTHLKHDSTRRDIGIFYSNYFFHKDLCQIIHSAIVLTTRFVHCSTRLFICFNK